VSACVETDPAATHRVATPAGQRGLSTLFYREPRLVMLAALVLIAAGASAFLALGRQEDPTITNLFATVTTVYPGADPARVESLVTDPIEQRLQGVAEIATLDSTSAESVSIVQIDLDEGLDDAGIADAWTDIRQALERVRPDLPAGALAPVFDEGSAGAWSAISAIVPGPGLSLATAARHARVLADDLRRVTGTDEVELFGVPDEQILVRIDAERLAAMSLTPREVSAAIGDADAKVRAGALRGAERDLLIEIAGELDTLERIRAVPLHGADARIVRVGDVAQVSRSVRTPASEAALNDGQPAILVATRLSEDLQVDVWMADVQRTLDAFAASLPTGLSHELVFDQSGYTIERLTSVGTSMAIGVALVIAVLVVTVGLRAALIVALVLPLVSLAAVATMNLIGLPLHQMSLTGLIVALGLLVDAAIVMTDEIGKRLRAGQARIEAVGNAIKRLCTPLLASTITTVLSFLPLALLPGAAGDFVGAIAIAVIIMLCWSFAIAMTLTAALAGRWLPADPSPSSLASGIPASQRHMRLSDRLAARTAARFRQLIALVVRYPLAAIALSLVLPLTGFLSIPSLVQQFFPGVERDQFHLELELGEGSTLTRTAEVAAAMDELVRAAPGIKQVSWVVGKSAPAFYYNLVGDRDRAPGYAQALIRTASPQATAQLVPQLQITLSERFPAARVIVRDLVQGPPVSAPVELRLVGPDLDVLTHLGERYRRVLSSLGSITVARASLEAGSPKLLIDVDETAARLAGLGLVDIADTLDSALEGAVAGSVIDRDGEALPVRVRMAAERRADLQRVLELPVRPRLPASPTPSGRSEPAFDAIPLSAVASATLQPSLSRIVRRNGERVNTVQGFIPYGLLPAAALKDVRSALATAGLEPPPGYRLEFGGDSDARNDTVNDLLASLGIIVTLSIAAVVLSLGSFRLTAVALLVAGLSAGLSFLALAVFGYPFGINALIGVIGSIGVSINAALIILSGLKADERAVRGELDAMVEGVAGSGRHIVSTTLTTFGGFLPLIVAGGAFWPPFAMAIAGGVLLSTVVSFGFVPAAFRLVYGRSRRQPSSLDEQRRGDVRPVGWAAA